MELAQSLEVTLESIRALERRDEGELSLTLGVERFLGRLHQQSLAARGRRFDALEPIEGEDPALARLGP